MQDVTTDGDPQREGRRLRSLVDAAPDAMLVVAPDGRIEFANARAAVMFGHTAAELVGSDVDLLVPERSRRAHRRLREDFQRTPRARTMGPGRTGSAVQLTARHADGSEFPVDVSLSPLPDVEGAGVICVVRDATDRVRSEQAVLRSEALLHDEQRRVAVAHARERIGMDLHDGVIQSLYSVGMQLAAAERRTDDPVHRAEFSKAIDAIDEVIGEIRSYIHGLRPGPFDERGLASALYGLAAAFEAATGVTVRIDVEEAAAEHLEPWGDDCVQVVRELLSNVARHARASNAHLSLVRSEASDGDASVVLVVADDGVGFDPHDPHSGMGAGNIRRRVQPAGGVVEIVSTPGAGTTVRISFVQAS